jgi:hypothetical protein
MVRHALDDVAGNIWQTLPRGHLEGLALLGGGEGGVQGHQAVPPVPRREPRVGGQPLDQRRALPDTRVTENKQPNEFGA